MGTSGRVHMMVAGVPAGRRQVDPPFHPETFRVLFACWDLDVSLQYAIFGTTSVRHVVPTRWKQNLFAILAIDLIMEEEIRRQSPRAGRVHAATGVANREMPGRWSAVFVKHFQLYPDTWKAVE